MVQPAQYKKFATINQKNSGFDRFCPTNVQGTIHTKDILFITNDCDGQSQAILEYDITDSSDIELLDYTTFPKKFGKLFVCPTRFGYFGGSQNMIKDGGLVYVSNRDNLDAEYVPRSILGETTTGNFPAGTTHNFEHTCLNNRIVVHDKTKEGITSTVIAGTLG